MSDTSSWDVDPATMTTTHECGLVIQYRPSDDGDGLVGVVIEGQDRARSLYSEAQLRQMFEDSGYAMMAALYEQPHSPERLH